MTNWYVLGQLLYFQLQLVYINYNNIYTSKIAYNNVIAESRMIGLSVCLHLF